MNVVRSRLSTLQLPLLKLTVSMHSLTPRIQSHLQLAADALRQGNCDTSSFVQLGSEIVCSLSELKTKLSRKDKELNTPVETYSFDHIFPGSENNTRTVVLYSDVGSKEFKSFHELLVKPATDGKIRYIARHFLKQEYNRRVRLSGYGVELHLKSTEYKSQDDAPKPADDGSAVDAQTGETEVQGFDFKVSYKCFFLCKLFPLKNFNIWIFYLAILIMERKKK